MDQNHQELQYQNNQQDQNHINSQISQPYQPDVFLQEYLPHNSDNQCQLQEHSFPQQKIDNICQQNKQVKSTKPVLIVAPSKSSIEEYNFPIIEGKKNQNLLTYLSQIKQQLLHHSSLQFSNQKFVDPKRTSFSSIIKKCMPKKKRNGTTHQSYTQKVIKKISSYHFSKNYKQQRNCLRDKVYSKTGQQLNLQNFKESLETYCPKPCKKSTFINNFQKEEEKQFMLKIFQNSVRKTFVLMYETEMRRKDHDVVKNEETQKVKSIQFGLKGMKERQPCLDEIGNKELMGSFDQIFEKSVKDFRNRKQRQGISLELDFDQFRNKLQRLLES